MNQLNLQQQKEVEKIIIEYDGLIKNMSKYFYSSNKKIICSLEDFIQEARLITIKAFFSYDSTKGDFKNYLVQSIRYGLSDLGLMNNSPLSLTKQKVLLASKVFVLEKSGLSVRDIAKKLKTTEKEVQNLRNVLNKEYLSDNIYVDNNRQSDVLNDLKSILNENEYTILRMHLDGKSLLEISIKAGKSTETIRKNIKKILDKIKAYHES